MKSGSRASGSSSGTSPHLAGAMEAAMAGAAEFGRASRRLMQRIWDPAPINNRFTNEPVWCLGRTYSLDKEYTPTHSSPRLVATTPPSDATKSSTATTSLPITAVSAASGGNVDTPPDSIASSYDSSLTYDDAYDDGGWPPAFLDDFESRIWMTYRTGFEPIARSTDPRAASALSLTMRIKTTFGDQTSFSSDTGWGCMIRSGQSLLANAISISRLGRDWRRNQDPDAEKEVLALFADDPRAPYSVQNFVRHGATACGKHPGEWFGPSATARCIAALVNQHDTSLRVYSTDLPEVYEDSFMATANPQDRGFQPTLVLVGTRLGIDKINRVYYEALIATLQLPQSLGIAGGRPSSSHYFVGCQGKRLFYLDPHHPRPALRYHENVRDYTPMDMESCHTRRLRHLHVEDMDPSMLVGFLIRNEEDWEQWKMSVKHVQGKAIITVSPNDPAGTMGSGRAGAIDEVEPLSDDDADTVLGT